MVDRLLVERAAGGSMEAFGQIYEIIYPKAVQIIRAMSRDQDVAEQVVQDTVVHFMQKDCEVLKKLEDYSRFEPYFLTAAKNRYLNFYKSKRTQAGDVKEVYVDELYDVNEDGELDRYLGEGQAMSPEQYVEHQEVRDILLGMIDELPDTQKEAFNLFVIGDMKQAEIAQTMGVPLNTVKSYLQYAKKKLAAKVTEYEKKNDTKLHSVLPILPFLRLMFAQESIPMPNLETLLAAAGTTAGAASTGVIGSGTVVRGTSAAGSSATGTSAAGTFTGTSAAGAANSAAAVTAAATGGKVAAASGLMGKVIACIVAAAVVGAAAVTVPKMMNRQTTENADVPVVNDAATLEGEGAVEETIVTEPLPEETVEMLPLFDENGKQVVMEPGVWYDYHTLAPSGAEAVGQAMVYNYQIIDGNEYLPAKEGFVWKIADIAIYFPEDKGFQIREDGENCYDPVSFETMSTEVDEDFTAFPIQWHGQEVECLVKKDALLYETMHKTYILREAYQVPADFDGMALALRSSAIAGDERNHLSDYFGDGEGFLVYRFGNEVDADISELTNMENRIPMDPAGFYVGPDGSVLSDEDFWNYDTSGLERGFRMMSPTRVSVWFGDSFGWVNVMW